MYVRKIFYIKDESIMSFWYLISINLGIVFIIIAIYSIETSFFKGLLLNFFGCRPYLVSTPSLTQDLGIKLY
jgi:hypothetical protein